MLTIDLEPELETTLNAMAQKEHSSPGEIAKRVISHYLKENQASELLIDIVATLPEIAGFKDKDPLEIQQALRNETPLVKNKEHENVEENKRQLLELINAIKPVKAPYSSEEMIGLLRAGKEEQIRAKQELFSLMATIPDTVSLADELIKERREEAKRELQDNE